MARFQKQHPFFKITFEDGRAPLLGGKPDKKVLLNDQVVGELSFNMTGYIGTLPTPDGKTTSLTESSFTKWSAEARKQNRIAKDMAARNEQSNRRFIRASPTTNGDVWRCFFETKSSDVGEMSMFIPRSAVIAGIDLVGQEKLTLGFFDGIEKPAHFPHPSSESFTSSNPRLLPGRYTMGAYKTTDPAYTAVLIGDPNPTTLQEHLTKHSLERPDVDLLRSEGPEAWNDQVKDITIIQTDVYNELRKIHQSDFFPVLHLPLHGQATPRMSIFERPQKKPKIFMPESDAAAFKLQLNFNGYRTEVYDQPWTALFREDDVLRPEVQNFPHGTHEDEASLFFTKKFGKDPVWVEQEADLETVLRNHKDVEALFEPK